MAQSPSLRLKFNPSFTEGFLAYSALALCDDDFKNRTRYDVLIYVWEPIVLGQSAILYDDSEVVQGFVTWGWLDREQEKRFISHRSRLRDFAHETEDDVPWMMDMLAPNGFKYVIAMVRGLAESFSNNPEFNDFDCVRALRPCGRLVRFRRNNGTTRF